MTTYRHLTLVWAVLVVLTFGSFAVGIEQRGDLATIATLVVIGLAMVKLRLIGLHFMDLRSAPRPLRALFESYVVVVFVTLAALTVPWPL
ncbi:hypothetical protein FPV58_18290 [Mycolicibacterium porcinum]|uniref:cytochrome C oxidase subunit IV family protein n=1 Tax=Mycolicibacterium porcinum TaxID=39693 RepID=UPI0011942047|nr:cytochrome C oxidase subunit IV family protein [Mycolicibacterium porcinum]TVX99362.1 hypothetical protein FPV58_18290 [Mycolicibacterium porcinum]